MHVNGLSRSDVPDPSGPGSRTTGSGEPALSPVPAAIANAFFDATGVRLRESPMTPSRVRGALRNAARRTPEQRRGAGPATGPLSFRGMLGRVLQVDATLGLDRGEVVLVDGDPRWADAFAPLAAVLARALDGAAIEHVGSTAVPGLRAKPILDVAVGVASPSEDDLRRRLEPLDLSGAATRTATAACSSCSKTGPTTASRTSTSSGSAATSGGSTSRSATACAATRRRAPPTLDLKETLAARFPHDRRAYTDGKAAFIEALLADELKG